MSQRKTNAYFLVDIFIHVCCSSCFNGNMMCDVKNCNKGNFLVLLQLIVFMYFFLKRFAVFVKNFVKISPRDCQH